MNYKKIIDTLGEIFMRVTLFVFCHIPIFGLIMPLWAGREHYEKEEYKQSLIGYIIALYSIIFRPAYLFIF